MKVIAKPAGIETRRQGGADTRRADEIKTRRTQGRVGSERRATVRAAKIGLLPSVETWLISHLWVVLFRLYFASWRKRCAEKKVLYQLLRQRKNFIGVFWHGKFATLFPLFHGIPVCVFASRSTRGHIIAQMCRQFGYRAVEIPDKGREVSYKIMRDALAKGQNGALAIDGPVGPSHHAKTGAVRLASELGYPIVPVSGSSTHKKVVESRWDRLQLPRLFSKVCMVVGEPIWIPPNLTEDEIDEWTQKVQQQLEQVDQKAESRAQRR